METTDNNSENKLSVREVIETIIERYKNHIKFGEQTIKDLNEYIEKVKKSVDESNKSLETFENALKQLANEGDVISSDVKKPSYSKIVDKKLKGVTNREFYNNLPTSDKSKIWGVWSRNHPESLASFTEWLDMVHEGDSLGAKTWYTDAEAPSNG